VSIGVHEMSPTGAGAVGWPIIWSLPLFPLRLAHALGYHGAFYLGIAIALCCNVATVAATALIARRLVPGRLALLAPALLVAWPFLMRFVEGAGNVYGSWLDDEGLLLYAEPLSTALVTTALALLILRRSESAPAALAGALLGFSVAVRVSNGTIAAVAFAALLFGASRRSLANYAAACVGAAIVAAVFWPRGYESSNGNSLNQTLNGLFSWHYLLRSWRDSTVFDWKMLVILLPLAILGLFVVRRRPFEGWLLVSVVVVTAAFYSAYYITALHPRFLFVALPPLFVLIAAGAERLIQLGIGRATPRRGSPGSRPRRRRAPSPRPRLRSASRP